MKKQQYTLYTAIVALLLLFGCTKEFLTVNPHDRLSESSFWKTEKDIDLGLAGCYNTLHTISLFNNRNLEWDGLTDNSYDKAGGYLAIARGPINKQTGSIVSGMYTSSYNAIARYNEFLLNVDKAQASADFKNVAKGEVRFLRALMYFNLVRLYGGIPILTKPYKVRDALLDRPSVADVYAQIYSDVDFAIENLPEKIYAGHALKSSAQLLKLRALMAEKKWSEAAALGKQMIDENTVHSLYNNFRNMFIESGQDGNPEILLSTKYLEPNVVHNSPMVYGWWTPINPYQSFVDAFECTDGKSITESPLYDATKPDENRDPRLFATIITPNSEWNAFMPDWPTYDKEKYPIIKDTSKTGFLSRKGWNNIKTERATALWYKGATDTVLMRWAEVLLNYAEAENEANGPGNAYAAINAVRTRSGVDMPPLSGLTKESFRAKVRHERRIEFAFEIGMRYFDLKRWGIEKEVLDGFDTGIGNTKYRFEDHYTLWPLPQTELDFYSARGKTLEQNPGY